MAKKITGYINLIIPAGQANPSPPIGPALGQQGVNIMEFCKAFNAKTREDGKRHAHSRRHHGVRDRSLYLHHQAAAGELFPQEELQDPQRLQNAEPRTSATVTKAQVRKIAER